MRRRGSAGRPLPGSGGIRFGGTRLHAAGYAVRWPLGLLRLASSPKTARSASVRPPKRTPPDPSRGLRHFDSSDRSTDGLEPARGVRVLVLGHVGGRTSPSSARLPARVRATVGRVADHFRSGDPKRVAGPRSRGDHPTIDDGWDVTNREAQTPLGRRTPEGCSSWQPPALENCARTGSPSERL